MATIIAGEDITSLNLVEFAGEPALTDDETNGFRKGHVYRDTTAGSEAFLLLDAGVNAADWVWMDFAGEFKPSDAGTSALENLVTPQAHQADQVLVTLVNGAELSDIEDLNIDVSVSNYTPGGTTVENHLAAIDAAIGAAAGSPFPQAIRGLRLERQSTTTVRITPGMAVDSTDAVLIANTTNRDVDTSTTGANGLDTGTLAASTEYYLFIIEGSSGVAGLASLSQTSPALPANFDDSFRRVGVFLTDATPDIMDFSQRGTGTTRRYYWNESRTGILEVLTSGTATTFTTVGLSAALPSTADSMQLMIVDGSNNRDAIIREPGSIQAAGALFVNASTSLEGELFNVSQQLQYENSGAGGDTNIAVIGFTESLDG